VQEAVSERGATRVQTERGDREHVAAEQREQPAHRPAEAVVARVPAHGFRELQRARDAGEHSGQHLPRGPAGVMHGDGHVLALCSLDAAHGGGLDTLARAEAE